jgi:hypothetical protein
MPTTLVSRHASQRQITARRHDGAAVRRPGLALDRLDAREHARRTIKLTRQSLGIAQ